MGVCFVPRVCFNNNNFILCTKIQKLDSLPANSSILPFLIGLIFLQLILYNQLPLFYHILKCMQAMHQDAMVYREEKCDVTLPW